MPTFDKESPMPVSADALYRWHMQPGAFDALIPPWQNVEVLERPDRLEEGARLVMKVYLFGPVGMRWVALHRDFVEGRQFVDEQLEGPFAEWEHTHRFEPVDSDRSILHDHVEYEPPMGALGRTLGAPIVERMLERMFDHRHELTETSLREGGELEPPA
jgi:ligand-binding SRPBCC domain-containing protein